MSKFIVFDRCEFMSCQWSTQRHLFPEIVVAYAGVHGKTAFLDVLLVSINTENVVYDDIICCAASWEAVTRV